MGEATPFNRLGRLGERCNLPSGVRPSRHRLWCIHTYVLYKIQIDNIAVVLPLVVT